MGKEVSMPLFIEERCQQTINYLLQAPHPMENLQKSGERVAQLLLV